MRNPFSKKQADGQLLDYREDTALKAALARRADLAAQLPGLADAVRAAKLEADQQAAAVAEAELQNLSGNLADSDLAAIQSNHLTARRKHALAVMAERKATDEAARLDAQDIPAAEFAAKSASVQNLQARYLAVCQEMLAALESVPKLGQQLDDLRQLASDTFPYYLRESEGDGRFPRLAALPLVAESKRVIRYNFANQPYGATEVDSPADVTMPLITELQQAVSQLTATMQQRGGQ